MRKLITEIKDYLIQEVLVSHKDNFIIMHHF